MLKNKIILVLLLFISFFTNTGFTNVSQKPRTIYKVYLKGKVLGNIKSKESFEKYMELIKKSKETGICY